MIALLQRVVKTYRSSVVLRSSFWYILGTFALRGITFGSLFLFTRLLIPDQFGMAALYLIWVSPFSTIATLYVEAAVARTKFDLEWDEFIRFVSSVSFLGIVAGSLCLGLLFLLPEALIQEISGLPKPLFLLAAMTGILFMSFRVTMTIWETTYNYKRSIPVSLGVELTSITLSVILIVLALSGSARDDAAMGRITGYSLVYGTVGACLLLYNLYRGKTFVHLPYWKSAVTYSLPIIPHVMASSLLANFDRVLIAQYYGPAEVGIYAFGYQLGGIALLVWAATNTAWSPWYFQNMKEKNYAIIRQRTQQYLFLFTGLTAFLVIISPTLVKVLAPERYRDAVHIVPMIMVSGFFSLLYSFYANIEFFERKTGFVSLATLLSAGVNLGLNLLLLPRLGYQVAAWTTLAAYIALFLFHAFVVKVKMKELDTNNFGLGILLSVFMIALVVLVASLQH